MQIPPAQRAEMLAHLANCLPEEGCGVLGGSQASVSLVRPVSNDLHSPTAFRMAPQEQLQAFLELDKAGLDLLAIFHSHPNGPQVPSETDLAQFAYPGVLAVICVPVDGGWIVRGFVMDADRVTEVTLSGEDSLTPFSDIRGYVNCCGGN